MAETFAEVGKRRGGCGTDCQPDRSKEKKKFGSTPTWIAILCLYGSSKGGGGGRQNEKKKKKKNRETEEGKLAAQMDCVHIISDQTRE